MCNFSDPFGLCPDSLSTAEAEECEKRAEEKKEERRAAVAACFERNTAWMSSENAFVAGAVGVFGGTGATIGGVLGQAAGREQLMRGAVDLDLFFGTRGASSGLVEGGISQVNAGRSLMATGRGMVRGGLVTLAAQATFVATYIAATGAICNADPNY